MFAIRPFDPDFARPDAWAEYHRFRRLRAEAEEPGEPVPDDADFEHDLRRRGPLYENHRLLAWADDAVVGMLGFGCRREDAPDSEAFAPFVYGWGGVLPSWRRQGVATALLRGLLGFMQERGKRILTVGTHLPEGRAFLAAIGAVEKNRNVVNRLALDRLDWGEVDRWHVAAIPPGSVLRWEIHAGRVPLERLAPLLPHLTDLFRDVPLGTLDLPPLRYELAGYASWYEEMDRRGGEHLLVLLMDGETVAGVCEATWSARFPDRASQELTAVARRWRGRGLAKGLKAAMLRLVRARHPQVRTMTTGNAEGNEPILAINRRLGFVEHRRDGTYQIGRDVLAAWLAGRPQIH
jgi:GNAT superfamily N-acetyltransferase